MKTGLRLIVCGGRDYEDKAFVFSTLDMIHNRNGIAEIIQGGNWPKHDADGRRPEKSADYLAALWGLSRHVKVTTVPAKWREFGPRAGPMRNREMLTLQPDGVVGFPGGKGTADMCNQGRAAGVMVWEPKLAA